MTVEVLCRFACVHHQVETQLRKAAKSDSKILGVVTTLSTFTYLL